MKARTKYIIMFSLIVGFVALDLITKWLFGDIGYTKIIPNLIHFETNFGNDGAAWGILSGKKVLLILIGVAGLIGIFVLDFFLKRKSKLYIVAISMFIAGALGNLIDRIFLGKVRDFINFSFINFPTFNLADCFLTISVVLLGVYFCFLYDKEKK